jgi:uncharacterized glyoxalase superfamily protein PhnB/uncharacterized protein YndB with AHSA1/START domain
MTTQDTAGPRTVSSEVTVAVDPQTAFSVFTDEIDLWWVRGPINFHDAARAIGMRCEPGVGGRLLELYSEDGSDALVLGRITAWQPGELLAWDSGIDDVTVEVRFLAAEGGTTVTVTATIPADGADNGGSAWVRVVPRWLGAWVARRDSAGREPADTDRLGLAIYYAKPGSAASWLADAFGFGPADEFGGDEYEHSWIEFKVGNCSVMLFPLTGGRPEHAPVTHVPWVFVEDLDAHLEHARSRGATIVSGIRQLGYRAYEAADLEGNHWTFAQARPTMR